VIKEAIWPFKLARRCAPSTPKINGRLDGASSWADERDLPARPQ
jgi:hypothetical protein